MSNNLAEIKTMGNELPTVVSEEHARNKKTAENLLATQLLLKELGHSTAVSLREARDALV